MSEWNWLFLALGLLFGLGIAFHGWFLQTGITGALSAVAVKIVEIVSGTTVVSVEQAEKVAAFVVQYRLPSLVYWFTWGAVAGAGAALVIGYGGIFATVYLSLRGTREDALLRAGRAAARYLTRGLKGYLADHDPAHEELRASFAVKRIRFNEALLENTRKAVTSGRLNDAFCRDISELLGSILLTTLFEPDGVLRNFRLAIYKIEGETLVPIVTVNRGDWSSHSSKPLPLASSFLGSSISEGQPLVYPRDKSGRKLDKRGKTRWKSFLTMPIPCGAGSGAWGGITIDHVGTHEVFTPERTEVLRDFARAVEMLYHLTRRIAA